MKSLKKIVMMVTVGMMMLSTFNAFCGEKQTTKEGFIPQMMGQVQNGGFVLTNSSSNNTVLQISGTKLSNAPKVLLTFHFGI